MVATAAAAVLLGCVRMRSLSESYRQRSLAYEESVTRYSGMGPAERPGRYPPPSEHDRWASRMAAKYERAARYPWLPVEPDPPEPE
jgi:hypothetical protein